MPKHEALTPKAIANRIKAKGLQKLRWYCQMCQKQCRDENGFKCHTMSESHQRQLLLFAENPDKYLDTFSQEFLDCFLELLKRRFGTKRVHANQVYQEYITDRHHVHMNSTQWETLTELVKWLGREGHCIVDHTEKGWFISYIDRDPETIERQKAVEKKEKMDMDDQERMAKFLEKQIERGKDQFKDPVINEYTELKRENEEEKVVLSLNGFKKKETNDSKSNKNPLERPSSSKHNLGKIESKRKHNGDNVQHVEKKRTALDEIIEEQERSKERLNRKDYWLAPNIVVKVVSTKLGEKYYKKKGVVQEVKDLYVGVVKMIDSGDVLKLDQVHLETVIPAEGRTVKVVNGAYRGSIAVLVGIDAEKFCATVRIDSGPLKGRVVKGLKYEDICKLQLP